MSKNKFLFPLIVMASLFFLFGFITTMNNSMIEFLKSAFNIESDSLKQLPNTFFYGAYALSVPVGFLINKVGYKNGVLSGLLLVAIGFFVCIPLVGMGYIPFLTGVAIFAIGVVILQVAANPYVNALGAPETAASRLTLTNALNSVATVIAPVFVSMLMVDGGGEPESVKFPFTLVAIVTVAILVTMFFLKLPAISGTEDDENGETSKYKDSAFKYKHVWLGSLAIFFYMGIEISIPSFFADFVEHKQITVTGGTIDMLKYYWGGLMVGRLIGIFVLTKFSARQILSICAAGGALFLLGAYLLTGEISMWLFLGTGLFHSIMWPTIYNLSLEDLGPHAKVASGVIATSVIGAAILMPIMGAVKGATGSVLVALAFVFFYYAYEFFFAQKGSKLR